MALTDSLVAFWNFEENRSFGDCLDSVGSNHLEQHNNPGVVQGREGLGRAFTREEENNYLFASDSADLSIGGTDFTWLVWVKWPEIPLVQRVVDRCRINKRWNYGEAGSWKLEYDFAVHQIRGRSSAYFLLYDNTGTSAEHGVIGRVQFSDLSFPGAGGHNLGDYYRVQADVWYMFLFRWEESSGIIRCDGWQGQTTAGDDPPIIWPITTLGRHFHDSARDGIASPGFTGTWNGANPLRINRQKMDSNDPGNPGNGDMDLLGFWKRRLTDEEGALLWNGGMGIGYPFNLPGPDLYTPIPGPIYLPVPKSLYSGHSWNVGETPSVSPPPEAGWMTQPTLPAWRVPARLRGWSYGNNNPIPDEVPLVTQWRLQTNEPVRDEEERKKKAISSSAPSAFPVSILFDPVVPEPPDPPDPPDPDSEAITDDGPYRPGRADQDPSRYLDSDGHVQ